MKNWDNLKHGDKVKCDLYKDEYYIIVWRGEKYIAGNRDMWNVNEFDPRDWEVVK